MRKMRYDGNTMQNTIATPKVAASFIFSVAQCSFNNCVTALESDRMNFDKDMPLASIK